MADTHTTCDKCGAVYPIIYGHKCLITKEGKDMVNHPEHYTKHKWEVIDILEEFFPDDPLLFTAGKYLLRANYKGNFIQDLEKLKWYVDRRIAQEKGQISES